MCDEHNLIFQLILGDNNISVLFTVQIFLINYHINQINMDYKIDQSQPPSDYSFSEKSNSVQKQSQILSTAKSICQFKNIPLLKCQFSSPFIDQYLKYFKDVQKQVDEQMVKCLQDTKRRVQYNLVLLKEDSKILSFEKPLIHLIGSICNGSIMVYEVVIGNYKLLIKLLNLNLDAPKTLRQLGSGGYGSVYEVNYSKNKYNACKRIVFKYHQTLKNQNGQQWKIRPNPNDLNEIITEYCIYKICSFYKIGPRINTSFDFDLVCFNQSVQFFMELCMQLSGDYDKLEQNLKQNLLLLHKLKIIHKDIKSSNTLYSPSYKRFILTDFGISHPIKQQIGKMTKTYRQGTVEFMSKEMKQIKQNQAQFIDLYYNDLYGLMTTLTKFKKYPQKKPLRQKIYLQSTKICEEYFHLNCLSTLLTRNKNKIASLLEQLNKQKIIIKSPIISSQFNDFYQIVYDIIKENHYNINIFNVFSIEDTQKLHVQFLIRCNGLSKKLEYQLNKLNKSDLISKILNQISSKQSQISIFNNQAMHLMKYNEKEFFLIRNIHNLEAKRQKHYQYIQEYDRQIFNNLYHLYNTIIIKPAQYTRSFLEILNKLNKYRNTQQQKIKYFLCLIEKYKKLGLPQLYFKQIVDSIANDHPQYMIQLSDVLQKFTYDKVDKIRSYNRCLKEYEKDENKYYIKILETLYLIIQQQNKIGEIQKMNKSFKKIQNKIKLYRQKLSQDRLKIVSLLEMKILGQFYKRQGSFDLALQYHTNYLNKLIEEEGYKYQKIARCHYEIGICYMQLLEYQQAETKIIRAIRIAEFFYENYTYDYFIKICNMQLIFIYALTGRIQKAQNCIRKIFYQNELERIHKNNKYLQFDEEIEDYVIQSTQALILKELMLILDQKTKNLVKTFDNGSQDECIQQLLIYKEQFSCYLSKCSYHQQIKKKFEKNKIENVDITFLQKYIQKSNQYFLKSIQTIILQFLDIKPQNFLIINLILAQILKLFTQYTTISNIIPIHFYTLLFEREYHANNDTLLTIIYLKFQYPLLKKTYSYQFINCAYRLSVRLFKLANYYQCIYYTTRMLNLLETSQCKAKTKIHQLYRKLIDCQILRKDYRLKKLQQLKYKQMKNKKKIINQCLQWALLYIRAGRMQRFMMIKCYIRFYLKKDIDIKIPLKSKPKVQKYNETCRNILEQNKKQIWQEQRFKNMACRKMFLKLQLIHPLFNNNLIKDIKNKIKKQIYLLNK